MLGVHRLNRVLFGRIETLTLERNTFWVLQPILFELEAMLDELLHDMIHIIFDACHLDIPKDVHDQRF